MQASNLIEGRNLDLESQLVLPVHNLDLGPRTLDPRPLSPDLKPHNLVFSRVSILISLKLPLFMNSKFRTLAITTHKRNLEHRPYFDYTVIVLSWNQNLGHQSYIGVGWTLGIGKSLKIQYLSSCLEILYAYTYLNPLSNKQNPLNLVKQSFRYKLYNRAVLFQDSQNMVNLWNYWEQVTGSLDSKFTSLFLYVLTF